MSLGMDVLDLTTASRATISESTRRSVLPNRTIREEAAAIVSDVRDRGDTALLEYSTRFGGGPAGRHIAVAPKLIEDAGVDVDAGTGAALDAAIWNVRACHEPQRPIATTTSPGRGVTVERIWSPIERIGVYVPGGRAVAAAVAQILHTLLRYEFERRGKPTFERRGSGEIVSDDERRDVGKPKLAQTRRVQLRLRLQIGRASCRERV